MYLVNVYVFESLEGNPELDEGAGQHSSFLIEDAPSLPQPPGLRGVPRHPLPSDEVHVDPQLLPPGQVQGVPGQGVQVHHQAVPAGQAEGTAERYNRYTPSTAAKL